MKIKLHKTQGKVALDKHRFKVVCAGRRWGKSVLSRAMMLKWAVEDPGLYWIVSPTYQQGKDIHWTQGFKKELGKNVVKRWNDSELLLTLHNGAMIQIKTAENPDRLRGVKLKGLIIDEIASIRNWNWLWNEVLRPTLVDYEAPAIFISTPKGYNHFYELFEIGRKKNEVYKSWRFTSYDNPYIPAKEIDQSKKELTEDTFAQEYMADFRKYTGLIYKGFDREVHIIDKIDKHEGWQFYRAFDFGSTNPTVCLWIGVDHDDNWFILDEHYESGRTLDYHSGVVNANELSSKVRISFGDPSGAQWIQEFADRGIYITPATRETGTKQESWVRFKIEKVAEKLKPKPGHMVDGVKTRKTGMPSLFILNTCVNTIKEFETYRWREKAVTQAQDINEPDIPEKANDHSMDALSYFACSYSKAPSLVKQSTKNWAIGAPKSYTKPLKNWKIS